jgi:hypothetical protein
VEAEAEVGQAVYSPNRGFGAITPFGLLNSMSTHAHFSLAAFFDRQKGDVQQRYTQGITHPIHTSLPPQFQRVTLKFRVTR